MAHSKLSTPNKALFDGKLSPVNNLKEVFRIVRNFLVGNAEGITRDETIAQNMLRLIFCKIYDEQSKTRSFYVRSGESTAQLTSRIGKLFEIIKHKNICHFDASEKIDLPPDMVAFIVERIQDYEISGADRDVVGDAFEEFIGVAFRGGSGQFFTPRNVVHMMIDVLKPSNGEKIIDPACGSGGFLVDCLRHFAHHKIDNFSVVGIDKDSFLAKMARIYCGILSTSNFAIYNENSLAPPRKWSEVTQQGVALESFDIVLTNPPFGAKIPIVGSELLSQYQLGRYWQKGNGKWLQTNLLRDKQPPQILFIERCLQLLKCGGRMGIILPEGVFGNPSDRYVWDYITSVGRVMGVVSLAQETFQPSTHTKTSVLFLEKQTGKSAVFMSVARAIGHDKNGKATYKLSSDGTPILGPDKIPVIDDDLPTIAKRFQNQTGQDQLGFWVHDIADRVYIPEYYAPDIECELARLRQSGNFYLTSIGELLDKKVIAISRGNEIGSKFYGSGNVPFVRTTDIVNWEIKIDTVKSVSEYVYQSYRRQQDVRIGDILFVSDGTFLIGRSAMVTKGCEKIIIQSHIKKIRMLDIKHMNPYYLFYLLNTEIVQKQITAKTFVQATISTLGERLLEIMLPVCKDTEAVARIANRMERLIANRAKLRKELVDIKNTDIEKTHQTTNASEY